MAKTEIRFEGGEVNVYSVVGTKLRLVSSLATSVFKPSGATHATGLVPDPGASSGSTKFLREDATWQEPSGGSGLTQAQVLARSMGS